ncbi:MAG: hypothetical protein DMH00_07925 [Acidobacteria bacterium]|nr:MAG: hypothetical protein DMH00_07925 [Acidobacteriota bacterium]
MSRLHFLRKYEVEAALFAGTLVLFVLSYLLYFHGGESFEFCQYAEIASNILSGRGFSTRTFYPSGLAYLRAAGKVIDSTGPVFERFPLYAVWSAIWLAVGGRGDFGMALGNGVAHALGAALTYTLGRRLFSRNAALSAAVLWALDPVLLGGFDLYGYADLLFGVAFGLLIIAYWAALNDERSGTMRFVWLGFGAGACFLARYSFLMWMPVFALAPLALHRRDARRAAGAFLAAFATVWLPWVVFETWQIGRYSPAFGLWNTAEGTLVWSLPWMEYRTFSILDFLTPDMPMLFIRKAWYLFNNFLRDIPTLWALSCLFPFAAAGMATSTGASAAFAGWVGLLFFWQWVLMSFLRYESLGGFLGGRYYLWFAPFTVLFAVDFLERKAATSRGWRAGRWIVGLLVAQLWLLAYLSLPRETDHASKQPVGRWPELEYVRDVTPTDSWVMTNMPAQMAWYTGRRTVNIPNDPRDVAPMLNDWPIEYLLISQHRVAELFNYPAWQAILKGGPEARDQGLRTLGFEIEQTFQEALLFKRKR